ncbi:MAG: 23S rRNA (pseudouridine(1915)-N(3))-methyltransferase RlmH [Burkholderiaceae bacterium]
MKLIVVAVGARMPGWVDDAWKDYAKRMPADCALELREIRPEPRSSGKTAPQLMAAEAKRIEAAIPSGCHKVALDERGKDLTTVQLASRLEQWRSMGSDVAFLIGGPDGLDPDLKRQCPEMLRLSALTLPHPMVRILLGEQLYRAWAIMTGHPYHRA